MSSDRDIYVLPQKRELNRITFVIWSMVSSVISFAVMNILTFWIYGNMIGYFSVTFVCVLADIFDIAGCIYYICKHDYAYGKHYESYQIINATIYGIQNYLRIFLAVVVISIMVVPIYYAIVLLVIVIILFYRIRRSYGKSKKY